MEKQKSQEKVRRFFSGDKFCQYNGIEIFAIEKEYSICKVDITKNHLNSGDTVQGGVIFTLADFAFAVHSNSFGKFVVSQNASITYLKPGVCGQLFARANLIRKGATICFYQVDITDEKENLIAYATINGYIAGENPFFNGEA